jgi:hypothetical protein
MTQCADQVAFIHTGWAKQQDVRAPIGVAPISWTMAEWFVSASVSASYPLKRAKGAFFFA